ncbi:hypothetical protein E2C01_040191 [Portunus trituberculatus]|uniref:Uncharacterized protein n=1 Tax=Portunus trituberculatus TaxID=210409 RepID=A0A5B7FGR0_PORTR|nr:hypothetical protein [Portunus trituberculatus]
MDAMRPLSGCVVRLVPPCPASPLLQLPTPLPLLLLLLLLLFLPACYSLHLNTRVSFPYQRSGYHNLTIKKCMTKIAKWTPHAPSSHSSLASLCHASPRITLLLGRPVNVTTFLCFLW